MPKVESSLSPLTEEIAEASWGNVGKCFIGRFRRELNSVAKSLLRLFPSQKVFVFYNTRLSRAQFLNEKWEVLVEISAHGEETLPDRVLVSIPNPLQFKRHLFEHFPKSIKIEYREMFPKKHKKRE